MSEGIIGIDEVGRGPLAGPVMVGIVFIPKGFKKSKISGVTDSKKLSEKKREEIYQIAKTLHIEGEIQFKVIARPANAIDRKGIGTCIYECIESGVEDFNEEGIKILLDGGLRAPGRFFQKTIVKGDSKEFAIGLASILAKVTRDEYMRKQAKRYPEYSFERHKGYGTKVHREKIETYGPCSLHRKTFIHIDD